MILTQTWWRGVFVAVARFRSTQSVASQGISKLAGLCVCVCVWRVKETMVKFRGLYLEAVVQSYKLLDTNGPSCTVRSQAAGSLFSWTSGLSQDTAYTDRCISGWKDDHSGKANNIPVCIYAQCVYMLHTYIFIPLWVAGMRCFHLVAMVSNAAVRRSTQRSNSFLFSLRVGTSSYCANLTFWANATLCSHQQDTKVPVSPPHPQTSAAFCSSLIAALPTGCEEADLPFNHAKFKVAWNENHSTSFHCWPHT